MLLDIPAVANTEGAVTNLTWSATRTYAYTGSLKILGSYVSGTFTDNETVTQTVTGATALVNGSGQASGRFLVIDAYDGLANATDNWVGNTSSAIFTPEQKPVFPDNVMIWIDRAGSSIAQLLEPTAQNYNLSGANLVIESRVHPPQGAVMKILTCAPATFWVPVGTRSFTIRNISGAVLYFRPYRPNIEANVIDTVAKTFGEANVVGQQLADTLPVAFSEGDFTSGKPWMLCATAAATGGAIVEFHF